MLLRATLDTHLELCDVPAADIALVTALLLLRQETKTVFSYPTRPQTKVRSNSTAIQNDSALPMAV